MQTRDSGAPLLTPTEVKKAIETLPEVDWLRLHRIARAFCRSGAFDPQDLLQETFQRALDGTRQCPRHVGIVRFLAGAMRSIASDWSKARRRRHEIGLAAPSGALREVVVLARDVDPDAYESLASRQETERLQKAILGLFADDPVARSMVEGIMDGIAGAELQSLTGLDETEFASKRRLIRRRIDKAFPKEWKP